MPRMTRSVSPDPGRAGVSALWVASVTRIVIISCCGHHKCTGCATDWLSLGFLNSCLFEE